MRVINEPELAYSLQLRRTRVQGIDEKYYDVLTYQLYDRDPPPEFHNFEVNVQEVDERGGFRELVVPYFMRFYEKEKAVLHHEQVLNKFDELLGLEAPKSHKKEQAEEAH